VSKFEEPPASLFGKNKEVKLQKTYTVTPTGVMLQKGEEIGAFQMGSTIVMMFEMPETGLVLDIEPGQKLKMGESITKQL